MDWKSLRSVTVCPCSTPFDQFNRKVSTKIVLNEFICRHIYYLGILKKQNLNSRSNFPWYFRNYVAILNYFTFSGNQKFCNGIQLAISIFIKYKFCIFTFNSCLIHSHGSESTTFFCTITRTFFVAFCIRDFCMIRFIWFRITTITSNSKMENL